VALAIMNRDAQDTVHIEMLRLVVVPGQSLLAILCNRQQVHEAPFNLTGQPKGLINKERSSSVGPSGWPSRMNLVRSCLPEHLASMHCLIAESDRAVAVGLGPNKLCYQRAAYLALALSSEALNPLWSAWVDSALNAPLLRAPEPKFNFEGAKGDIDLNIACRSYAVVWHVGGDERNRYYYNEDRDLVQQKYKELVGGPYLAVIIDPKGTIISKYGRYNEKHQCVRQLQSWWREQLCGEGGGSSSSATRAPEESLKVPHSGQIDEVISVLPGEGEYLQPPLASDGYIWTSRVPVSPI
jgi:hypothetical protein